MTAERDSEEAPGKPAGATRTIHMVIAVVVGALFMVLMDALVGQFRAQCRGHRTPLWRWFRPRCRESLVTADRPGSALTTMMNGKKRSNMAAKGIARWMPIPFGQPHAEEQSLSFNRLLGLPGKGRSR